MKNKLNVRIESCNVRKYTYEINHDLRIYNTKHIINNRDNRLFIPNPNKLLKIQYRKNNKIDYRKQVLEKIEELKIKHNTLYKKKQKRNLRRNNTNSINIGILTFPSEFTPEKFNMNQRTFIETGIKTIQNICKELDIELIYITCHLDETTPHFHFMTSNFDSQGNVIKRTKETGILLQDLGEKYFKEYGLERGVKKEITGLQNVRNEIKKNHKHLKDLKQEKEKIENEIKDLKIEKKDLENNIDDLKNKQSELYTDLKKMERYIKDIKNDYIKYEDEVSNKREIYKKILNPLISDTQRLSKIIKFNIREINKTLNDETFIKRFTEVSNLSIKLNGVQRKDKEMYSLLRKLIENIKPILEESPNLGF